MGREVKKILQIRIKKEKVWFISQEKILLKLLLGVISSERINIHI